MPKNTQKALLQLEKWFKSYRRWRWIRGIYYDFTDAYCRPCSPVSSADAPEIERLKKKISAWDDKAFRKYEDAEEIAFEIKERFRHNKMVMRRYVEISRYIAKIELCLPDDWVFPDYDEISAK